MKLAGQQAKRDEELNVARQRAAELEAEVADLVREVELRQEQEVTLKEVILVSSFPQCRNWSFGHTDTGI